MLFACELHWMLLYGCFVSFALFVTLIVLVGVSFGRFDGPVYRIIVPICSQPKDILTILGKPQGIQGYYRRDDKTVERRRSISKYVGRNMTIKPKIIPDLPV